MSCLLIVSWVIEVEYTLTAIPQLLKDILVASKFWQIWVKPWASRLSPWLSRWNIPLRNGILSTPFPSRKKNLSSAFLHLWKQGGWKMMKIPNRKLLCIKSCLRTQGLAMTTSPPPSPTRDRVGEMKRQSQGSTYPILDGWASGRWWEGVVRRLGKAFLNNAHA